VSMSRSQWSDFWAAEFASRWDKFAEKRFMASSGMWDYYEALGRHTAADLITAIKVYRNDERGEWPPGIHAIRTRIPRANQSSSQYRDITPDYTKPLMLLGEWQQFRRLKGQDQPYWSETLRLQAPNCAAVELLARLARRGASEITMKFVMEAVERQFQESAAIFDAGNDLAVSADVFSDRPFFTLQEAGA